MADLRYLRSTHYDKSFTVTFSVTARTRDVRQ